MRAVRRAAVRWLLIGVLPLVSAACATAPHSGVAQANGGAAERAAGHAAKMLGKPYRFGGSTPATGFDCSGLVQYSHLRRGDLLFFDQEGKKNSHVGLYVGDGYFVHAPSSGKRVRSDQLDSAYWRAHLSEARRLKV